MKCLIFWKWELSAYSPEKFNTFQIATLSKCWIIYLFPIKYFFYILQVSIVTRDEVGAYKPYLWEQSVFVKGPLFREWILTKVHCVSIYCFSPILCEINQLWWILSSTHCRKHYFFMPFRFYVKSILINLLQSAQIKVLPFLKLFSRNQFHVKSKWWKNFVIFTLCFAHFSRNCFPPFSKSWKHCYWP